MLSFLLPAYLHLLYPHFPLVENILSFFPSSIMLLFINTLLLTPFVSYIDVFAIGDPNQSTILAVSIAGGIILLIFLVTCFVVSGR